MGVPCSDLCKCEGCKNSSDKHPPSSQSKPYPQLDLNKMCAEVTISKLLEPNSPEVMQVTTADNSIQNSNGDMLYL